MLTNKYICRSFRPLRQPTVTFWLATEGITRQGQAWQNFWLACKPMLRKPKPWKPTWNRSKGGYRQRKWRLLSASGCNLCYPKKRSRKSVLSFCYAGLQIRRDKKTQPVRTISILSRAAWCRHSSCAQAVNMPAWRKESCSQVLPCLRNCFEFIVR